jgi:hypothetical protein
MDGEEQIHSLDLYAIWNAKAWMLEYVALQNPFKTAYFLCVDTGAFRSTKYRFGSWQNHRKAVQIFQKDGPQKLLLDLINRLPQKVCAKPRTGSTQNNLEHGPISQDLVEGTVFGGSSESIRWWSKLYYTTINLYISRKLFVGKDQSTMNSLAFAHPDRIHVILAFKLQCGDTWFAFGPLFADHGVVSNAFGDACQSKNLSSIIVPLTNVCSDETNLINR